MTRQRLITILSVLLIAAAILWFALPSSFADEEHGHAEESAEHEDEERLIITNEQMAASGIELHTVALGGNAQIIVPGTVKANPSGVARLDARADGTIVRITKTLGDTVARGETVAVMESAQAAQYSSDIAAAQARLTQAQANFEREQRLFDANVTARQDLEAAQTQLSVARADLARARNTATAAGVSGGGTIAITSPIAGRITDAPAVLGAFVTAGTELMEVVDPTRVQVEAAIPLSDVSRVSTGDRVTIVIGSQEIGGRIRSITPALDPSSRAATAIVIPDRLSPALQADAFVEVRIASTSDSDPNVISVPEVAVQTVEGRSVVFVREGDAFEPVEVQIGTRSAGRVTIHSGLEAGAVIASQNAFLLKAELGKSEAEHGH